MVPRKEISFLLNVLACFASVQAAGHCVWYGECGTSSETGKPVNCNYTGPAKPFQDPNMLVLYQQLCPDLYHGANTETCCSDGQMITLMNNMDVPKQLLSGCPACLHNFYSVYCYLTCHPQQSDFLYPKVLSDWVDPNTHQRRQQVLEIDFAMTPSFAGGMFESCKEVPLKGIAGELAIGILCGHSADECTAQNWLDYMGNIGNQQTPFAINFNITADPYINPHGVPMTPADAVITPTHCKNVTQPTQQAHPTNQPSQYRQEQITIERTGHNPDIVHNFPPPSTSSLTYTPLFDKDFLHEVLNLQTQVSDLTATHGSKTVSLSDVCVTSPVPGNDACVVLSILGYYGDNGTTLDRVAMDQFGFFILADYLDHFSSCSKHPSLTDDLTALHEPCLATFGGPVFPYDVLSGYTGPQGAVPVLDDDVEGCCSHSVERPKYETSTKLVLTWLVRNHHDNGDAVAWETAFTSFLQNYARGHPGMTLTWRTGPSTADNVILGPSLLG